MSDEMNRIFTASIQRQDSGTVDVSEFPDEIAEPVFRDALRACAQSLPSDATELDIEVSVEVEATPVERTGDRT